MPRFSDPMPLEDSQEARLGEIAERFEDAWQLDPVGEVDLAEFLPPTGEGPFRLAVLHELIKVELEIRWRRGGAAFLEKYVERFPELGSSEQLSPALVYEEYRVRQTHGDRPHPKDYGRRFPAQYEALLLLLQESPLTLPQAPPGSPVAPGPSAATPTPAGGWNSPTMRPERGAPAGMDYKLLEALRTADGRPARGAFGEVWRAEAPGGVTVAVKIIPAPPMGSDAADSSAFSTEKTALELIKNLPHPCLVRPHAYWVHDGKLHIAMDLADGSLLDRLHECRDGLPREELLGYFREIAEALDFLHKCGPVHRDVKPANILLYQGHAKLADFGLAREAHQTITGESIFGGTLNYMAPEVCQGVMNRYCDQFSLAVSYAQVRLGRLPFTGKGIHGIIRALCEDEPDLEGLPRGERAALCRALAKDRHKRFPSCLAFVDALKAAAEEEARPPRPTVWRGYALALVGLAALALVLWWSLHRRPLVRVIAPREPVWLDSNGEATVDLRIEPESAAEEVRLTSPDAEKMEIKLTDDGRGAAPGTRRARLRAVPKHPQRPPLGVRRLAVGMEGAGEVGGPVLLETRVLFLPPGFEGVKEGKEWVTRDEDQRWYYTRIVKTPFASGPPVEFVLIPWKPYVVWNNDPDAENLLPGVRAFYIMKNKVSLGLYRRFDKEFRGLYRRFDKEFRGPPNDARWRTEGKGRQDDRPVLAVSRHDATTFAEKVFGGKLPRVVQWEKAAGRFLPYPDAKQRPEGPYRGRWSDKPRPHIALGPDAPWAIGTAKDDVSPFGCRDLSGNGEELTWDRFVSQKKSFVDMRGSRCDAPSPFQFSFVEDRMLEQELRFVEERYPDGDLAKPGFRVVIEIP